MTLRRIPLCFALLLGLLLPPLASSQTVEQPGPRVALVMGNASYASVVPLRNPENDARAVAEALERLGFSVSLALNQSQRESIRAVEEFTRASVDADIALFYYSGHGLQLDGTNYLLPVDLEVTSPSSVQYNAVDAARLLRDIEGLARTSILILDACRDNPFGAQLAQYLPRTRSAGLTRGLQPLALQSRRSLVAYAAAAGATAEDGRSNHSPYTEALLDEIEKPGVEVGLMFRRVAGRVAEDTRDGQQPELLIRLPDPIYLAAAPETVVTAPEVADARLPDIPEAPEAEDATDSTAGEDAPAVTVEEAEAEATAPDPLLLVELPERSGDITRSSDPEPIAALPGESWGYPRVDPGLIYAPRAPWQAPASRQIDEVEPNNSLATAQPAQVADRITLTIAEPGDRDYFRLTTGSAGMLHARIYNSPGDLDMFARLLDFEGSVVATWQGADRPGADMDAAFAVPGPGLYLLDVGDGSNNAAAPDPMLLDMSFVPSADGYEPNGSFAAARPVPLDFETSATIFPRGDSDYYRFNVTRPGQLDLLIAEVPEEMDVFARAYDLNLTAVSGWIGPKRDGGDTEGAIHFAKPGVYFLQIKDGSDNAASAAAMSLETRFRPAPDIHEPNNALLEARDIPPSGEHELAIFPQGDNDYFAITVDHPGTLYLLVEDVPEKMDVNAQIYNMNGSAVSSWISPKRDGGDTVGEVDLDRPGRYVLRLKDGSDNATSWRGMKLITRYTRQADQYEPNDSRELASPLVIGGEVALNLQPRGDNDYFAINVTEPGRLSVEITDVDEALDVFVQTYDLNGTAIHGWIGPKRAGGDTIADIDFANPGTYFLRVKDGSDDARATAPFTMATHFTPALDGYEPNNARKSAHLIDVSGSDWLNTFPRGDNDYLYFHVNRPGALDLLADQVPENLDVYFQLYDGDGRAVSGWIGPDRIGGDTSGTVDLASAGWYWLRIKDGSDDAHAITPYRVTRRFRPSR